MRYYAPNMRFAEYKENRAKTAAPTVQISPPGGPPGAKNDGGGEGSGHIFPPLAGVPDLRYCAPNMRFAEYKENRTKTTVPTVHISPPGGAPGAKNDGGCEGFEHNFLPLAGVPELQ